jgi:diguanylate cyclase (GGDEF)-like protein
MYFCPLRGTFPFNAGWGRRRFRTSIRADIDWIARYGGEEFIIVFPETSLENTFKKADSLRRMISEKKVAVAGRDQVFVTVSFGVSSIEKISDGGDVSGDEMIKNADVCLYKAKSLGRNRVVKK